MCAIPSMSRISAMSSNFQEVRDEGLELLSRLGIKIKPKG